jgi:hypothetical protein
VEKLENYDLGMPSESFGRDCGHCHNTKSLADRFEKESGAKPQKHDGWHDENIDNSKMITKYDKKECGGVPFFFNTETKWVICGGCSYRRLKNRTPNKNK